MASNYSKEYPEQPTVHGAEPYDVWDLHGGLHVPDAPAHPNPGTTPPFAYLTTAQGGFNHGEPLGGYGSYGGQYSHSGWTPQAATPSYSFGEATSRQHHEPVPPGQSHYPAVHMGPGTQYYMSQDTMRHDTTVHDSRLYDSRSRFSGSSSSSDAHGISPSYSWDDQRSPGEPSSGPSHRNSFISPGAHLVSHAESHNSVGGAPRHRGNQNGEPLPPGHLHKRAPGLRGSSGRSGRLPVVPPRCLVQGCELFQSSDARGYTEYCSDSHARQAVREGAPRCYMCGIRPARRNWDGCCGQTCSQRRFELL
ncbi:hypothetical protein FA95DRAFT_610122 [Auriscalpium vulgare]|uniref:Uncharacterized protein n=1 Tax=Auriscalpium vulgare TaxID=40419 RepID=A0ACB8RE38_9AGAM|nr:hypothetical protein FA95DRAFT_610122 [Auriscalpium vulgare]